MGFKIKKRLLEEIFYELIVALVLVLRNFFLLMFYPYKTMRKLSFRVDYYQILIIFFLVFIYFKFAYFLRDEPYPATITFLVFLLTFFLTIFFFYFFSKILFHQKGKFINLVFSFAFTLMPTLIWFGATSLFYLLLPPPRTMSIFGRSFSIFFIAFSLSLLVWKMILVFLSLRFSLRLNFYQILYIWLLYFSWFIPYSILLYQFRLFRVPFI